MSSTLTVRHLDEMVKQKLRLQAARHGRSMEAEAREIIARDVMAGGETPLAGFGQDSTVTSQGKFDHLAGIWKGRMSTDEVMQITRGE